MALEVNRFINYGTQYAFVHSDAPSVAAISGFGAGKTHGSWLKILRWSSIYPGIPNGYFAPTYSLIRDIFVPEVEEFCSNVGLECNFKKQESILEVQGLPKVYCRSMNNPETIVGFEIGNAVVDEGDLLTIEKMTLAWMKIKARCRKILYIPGKKKKRKNEVANQMALASTPEGFGFAYEKFKRKPIIGSELYQMSTYDNLRNLPMNYIQELLNNYPPELVQAYIMGQFTNLRSGRVYTSYDRVANRSNHIIQPGEKLIIGMDFNVTRGCAVVYVERFTPWIEQEIKILENFKKSFYKKAGISAPRLKLMAVGEVINTFDTPETIRVIQAYWPEHPIVVIPDATGKNRKSVNATESDLSLLKQAGFRVMVNERNPNVKDRITAVNAQFCNSQGERNLFVNDIECPIYAEGLENQAYDQNGMPEKGATKMDDINDAGGYPIARLYPIKIRSTQVRKMAGI